jgi:putative ABC transport system ATP-binding protein
MTALAETRVAAPDVVTASGVSFAWPGRDAFRLSIDSFVLPARSRTLLIGPSGSGKSTFLNLLCGITSPDRGTIRIAGTALEGLNLAARDRFRAEHIGVIFQMFNLLPYGSVIDNVVLPLRFAPARRRRAALHHPVEAEAARLLMALGLPADRHKVPTATLSIGQQQRVAAARALIGAPDLIVADEPTSALDRAHQDRFLDLLFAQLGAAGASLVMVSHDESLGARFDRTVALSDIIAAEDVA